MNWLRRNAIGLLGTVLALVALALGFDAYRSAVQGDEQARGVAIRLKRGETDLAERHRRGAAVLSRIANAERSLTFYAAGAAIFAGAWCVRRPRTSLWLTAATIALAIGAIVLALESRGG